MEPSRPAEDKRAAIFRLWSGLLTILFLAGWYAMSSEAEPGSLLQGPDQSSRFQSLRSIAASANAGYYFQIEPGIPMENHWEDPGTAFLMVVWGWVKKKALGFPLDMSKDPYRVEFFVLVLPLFFLFFSSFFSLPKGYWWIPPLFFLWSAIPFYKITEPGLSTHPNGLLQLSIAARWAKLPAAFWLFTINLQMLEWWKKGCLFSVSGKRCAQLFVCGLILGTLISIRKDIAAPTFLGILGAMAFFVLTGRHTGKKIGPAVLMLACLYAGYLAVQGCLSLAWKIRDRVYVMKDFPRINGHPTWHSLYAALGKSIPGKTIRWGDEDAWKEVSSLPENRSIRYGSREHEQAAKKLYLKTITEHPGPFLYGLFRKAGILVKGSYKLLGMALALTGVVFWKRPDQRPMVLLLFLHLGVAAMVPTLVIPDIIYSYDFRAHQYLALLAVFCLMVPHRHHEPVGQALSTGIS